MQGLHPICQEIAGFKRHLPIRHDFINYDNLYKQVKFEEPTMLKLDGSQFSKKPLDLDIPPLKLNNPPRNMDYIQPLILLDRAQLMQQYLQLLTLRNYAEQQRSLLDVRRDNSSTSCSSYSSCDSFSPIKEPILMPKSDRVAFIDIPKFDDSYLNKKTFKVSACKNYIALLCTGFARSMLTGEAGSEIISHLQEIMNEKKAKYIYLEEKDNKMLEELMMDHIQKDICGKKVKKTNKGRDFKVRNTEELELLLNVKEEDSDLVKFRKEVLKEMLDYFFVSKYYLEWLDKGMINDVNKNFFLKNKVEIQKKFANPTLYKPHFDYNSN